MNIEQISLFPGARPRGEGMTSGAFGCSAFEEEVRVGGGAPSVQPQGGLRAAPSCPGMPDFLDDGVSDSEVSSGSASSEVLKNLDKLSKFMMERNCSWKRAGTPR